ncbi:hypothetical protein B0O80DRAFT_87479 [Mortierella sp. GBAus27b]|nr:hypothetical protein B0O80DRAFT_87479 [Mortierella sp. GBAus27b]
MAQHHHALHLPEVLFRIGRHLESLEDVVACSLVSKTFRASFEPFQWMNIHLGRYRVADKKVRRDRPFRRSISLVCCSGYGRERQALRDKIMQGLQRIAPWIRSLSVWDHSFLGQLKLGDRCTGINALWITGIPINCYEFDEKYWEFGETYWNDCVTLLTQNSACLRSLTLWRWGAGQHANDHHAQPLWKMLLACEQHTNLTSLRIQESGVSERELEALWRICRQLEILELTEVYKDAISPYSHNDPSQAGHNFEEQVSTSVDYSLTNGTSTNWSTPAVATATTVRFPKLRELTLDDLYLSSEHQLEQILLHCPLLQTLIWITQHSEHSIRRFCDHLTAQTWPYLDWMEIESEGRDVTSQEHNLLLQSSPRLLRCLHVNIGSFEEQIFNLYRERGHFTTLTKIDLTQSMLTSLQSSQGPSGIAVPSKQVQEVLESCLMLEHIVAMMVTAQDIIQGKPWVCHRLKKFEVMINMEFNGQGPVENRMPRHTKYTKDNKFRCHQIFERLGQLSQLTVLDMSLEQQRWIRSLDIRLTSLPLRLRMGLGCLSTLRNLEVIGYVGHQKIRVGDMEWMVQHWNKLRKITGDRLDVKWSRTPTRELDERSTLVKTSLKERNVKISLDTHFGRYMACEDWESFHGSETESEYAANAAEQYI